MAKEVVQLDRVIIRFAGDSGDGMQLTGSQFTNNTALLGIDLATFPDFPAEIRAPLGTLAGVSGFQLRFSSNPIFTPGDECDVLVAMNAAALKVYQTIRAEGSQKSVVPMMQTRAELYDYLGYHSYEQKLDNLFFVQPAPVVQSGLVNWRFYEGVCQAPLNSDVQ